MTGTRILIRLINFFVAVVAGFLALRLLLRLFAANPGTSFVTWVYTNTAPLLEPFRGIFPSQMIEPGYVLEFSTLFAIVIYMAAGWLLTEIVYFVEDAVRRPHQSR